MSAPGEWHQFRDSVRWRLTDEGVEIEGSGVERSRGRPTMVTRVWEAFGDDINAVSKARGVPVPLIIATICTESGGNPDAVRLEPGYSSDQATPHRVSVGLTQTLISTARESMRMSVDREWLRRPRNAIDAGTAYIAHQRKLTSLDPPLVAAAYNAGRLAHQTGDRNRWKLRQYPIGTGEHCDRFVRFYNDAVAVLAGHSRAPAVGHDAVVDQRRAPVPMLSTPRRGADVQVEFASSARAEAVSDYTLGIIKDILHSAGLRRCLVTSTARTPADQARVMFNNLERYGADHQRKLYASPGRRVIDVYVEQKARGATPERIKQAMEQCVLDTGPSRVSRHVADPAQRNVIDIAPSSITDRGAFEAAVRADKRLALFLTPPQDPAYHLEIVQAGEENSHA